VKRETGKSSQPRVPGPTVIYRSAPPSKTKQSKIKKEEWLLRVVTVFRLACNKLEKKNEHFKGNTNNFEDLQCNHKIRLITSL
jgi:hypothetical protein